MTPEERKEYNKKYYTSNKNIILEKAYNKEVCQLCGRTVIHANLERHKTSELCSRTQLRQQRDNDRLKQIQPTI